MWLTGEEVINATGWFLMKKRLERLLISLMWLDGKEEGGS
jgi:hypothetical protein